MISLNTFAIFILQTQVLAYFLWKNNAQYLKKPEQIIEWIYIAKHCKAMVVLHSQNLEIPNCLELLNLSN